MNRSIWFPAVIRGFSHHSGSMRLIRMSNYSNLAKFEPNRNFPTVIFNFELSPICRTTKPYQGHPRVILNSENYLQTLGSKIEKKKKGTIIKESE